MTDKLYESLSALMDDETDQLELRRLLKADGRAAVLNLKNLIFLI